MINRLSELNSLVEKMAGNVNLPAIFISATYIFVREYPGFVFYRYCNPMTTDDGCDKRPTVRE